MHWLLIVRGEARTTSKSMGLVVQGSSMRACPVGERLNKELVGSREAEQVSEDVSIACEAVAE